MVELSVRHFFDQPLQIEVGLVKLFLVSAFIFEKIHFYILLGGYALKLQGHITVQN